MLTLHINMCSLLCSGGIMASNLAIDEELLVKAKKIGGHKSKKDTVNTALKEYIQRRKQMEITEVYGNIEYDEKYDYKKHRKNRK